MGRINDEGQVNKFEVEEIRTDQRSKMPHGYNRPE